MNPRADCVEDFAPTQVPATFWPGRYLNWPGLRQAFCCIFWGMLWLVSGACSHGPTPQADLGLFSIDVLEGSEHRSDLSRFQGKILVIDVCAAWSDPCLLNARAVDEACRELCGESVIMISLLLDDPVEPALRGYRSVLGVSQRVLGAGPQTRSGRSVLGEVHGIPRLVIFDAEGEISADLTGGIVSLRGLSERVRALREKAFPGAVD